MNIWSDLALVKHYLFQTICENFVVKFIGGIVFAAFAGIYAGHTPVINFIILAFIIDLFLGVSLAAKVRSFASWKLFKGAMKLWVYGILIYIGSGIDLITHTGDVFISFMFAFIILRDASSIIEKLHLLGFNVPFFLIKYLDVAQQRLDSQITKILETTEIESSNKGELPPVPPEPPACMIPEIPPEITKEVIL